MWLEMYKDGFSLPALSEKIMFAFEFAEFEEFRKKGIDTTLDYNYNIPDNIDEKILQYEKQDIKAKRSIENYITKEKVSELIKVQSLRCYHCHNKLSKNTWTLDRIECDVAHTNNNCVIACDKCNVQRKDELFNKFLRKKSLLRYARLKPMIYLIDEANKEVFYKLKNNITGGASIVFHRYHEADKTEISRVHYDLEKKTWNYDEHGKTVKRISGFDANALYLWCIGECLPCGKLRLIETDDLEYIKDTEDGKFFGFLEVDMHVTEEKYEYFSEMCPIFKNMEYSQEESGEYMKEIIKRNSNDPSKDVKYGKTRKLISSLKGTKLLIKSERLAWMIKHGCIVDKLYGIIPAQKGRVFKAFMEKVSEERRKGDADPKYAIIAEMWKLVGNSAFGRTGMNKNKHKNVKYCTEMQFNRKKYEYFYYDVNIYDDVYEVFSKKKKVQQNIPIQVACSIYDDSKRRMLEFYYDCVDKYLDRKDFQYVEMDTDSAYMALTGKFEELVKPELKEEFLKDRINWFPRNDTPENAAFDKRTPGLFKIEFDGTGIVALCSKMYYVKGFENGKDKLSAKGIQQRNNQVILNFESYKNVLFTGKHNTCHNTGLRVIDKGVVTYETDKKGLSPVYDKRVVMDDGIHCRPLDL
jgi:hypothetical protein